MAKYIEREALLEQIDGILDCNDMVFRPNDHCCNVPEDCKGCKWAETRGAIRRIVENAPAADVRPVVRGKWIMTTERFAPERICSPCKCRFPVLAGEGITEVLNFCPNCGAEIKEES